MPILEVDGLTRRFGDYTAADSVSLSVDGGEIFGFLGPNGAGKSTTINMLCTLLRPSSGTAAINGYDVVRDQARVRRSIGLVFQEPTLDERLTALQNMRFHAMLYNVPMAGFDTRARELLEMVDLADRASAKVESFSGGMKRRLEIAIGLLHHPKVLFLDEPTIGLDPQTRRRIWEYVDAVRQAEGLTVFLTTHYMDEAEICDRIAIIDHGRIVACDTPEGLKRDVGGDRVELAVAPEHARDAAACLARLGATVLDTPAGSGAVRAEIADGDRFLPRAIRALDADVATGCATAASLQRPTLDDVFMRLTGHEIRDEGAGALDTLRANFQAHKRGH